MRRLTFALALSCSGFLLLLAPLHANAQPQSGLPAEKADKLDAAVAELMKQHQLPGLSVAVAQNGQVVWCKGFGKADQIGRAHV